MNLPATAARRHQVRAVLGQPHIYLVALLRIISLLWSAQQFCLIRSRLVRLGPLRILLPKGLADKIGLWRFEATLDGMRLVAANQRLSTVRAVEPPGRVWASPTQVISCRDARVVHFEHTSGPRAVLADSCRAVRALRARGEDDQGVGWKNAGGSARYVRPDGHVAHRHCGQLYGVFPEYHRGTMRLREYRRKLLAYAEHLERDRYSRDYVGFPTIVFLTLGASAEERIVRAARLNQVESRVSRPILVTHL